MKIKTNAGVRQYMKNLARKGLVNIKREKMKMNGQPRYELVYVRTALGEKELKETIKFFESIR